MTREDVILLAMACEYAREGTARAIRERAELSIEAIAGAVGSSKAALSRWERGERTPRGQQAVRWASLLMDLERRQRAAAKRV